jgi:hypothetical protein
MAGGEIEFDLVLRQHPRAYAAGKRRLQTAWTGQVRHDGDRVRQFHVTEIETLDNHACGIDAAAKGVKGNSCVLCLAQMQRALRQVRDAGDRVPGGQQHGDGLILQAGRDDRQQGAGRERQVRDAIDAARLGGRRRFRGTAGQRAADHCDLHSAI